MSDQTNDVVEPESDQEENFKQIRAEAEEAPKLRRQLAAVKAGIDLDSRQGQAWANSFDGDWNDVDAMKADYAELFPTPEPAPSNEGQATEVTQTDRGVPESQVVEDGYQTGMTEDLRDNQSGVAAPPGTTPPEDPTKKAMRWLEEARVDGTPVEHVQAAGIDAVIGAAMNGDERYIWSDAKRDEWMVKSGLRKG